MKTMKRIMALLICFVMVMGMTVTAFADDNTQMYTIKALNTDHQYEIYQIFTGTCSGDVLSNVKWGKNGTETEGEAVSADVLTALTNVNGKTNLEKLNVIKKYVNLSSLPFATITNGETYTAVAGYYLIKDREKSLKDESEVGKNDVYTTYIVKVVGDVDIQTKSDVPVMEKKVKDINDFDGSETGWQDSADYDINDPIPFKLEGTVAANYADYEHYYFAFHDEEEVGLNFKENSVKVYLDDSAEPIADSHYEVKTKCDDHCTFEVIFMDLKKIEGISAGTKIRVEYTATLTNNATIGKNGNVNKAKLEYSNNPNNTGNGTQKPDDTGNTPWDNVIVFTYKVVVNKVDSSGEKLIGAAFKLEKVVKNENDENTTNILIKAFPINLDEEISKFEFTGLDDGKYILTETETPAGYNSIDPITFTVTAEHTINWKDQDRAEILMSLSGNQEGGNITLHADNDMGTLTTDIVNQSGSTLPSTGGIGTRIFYIIGGILMAAAAVVLITKARYKKEK